MSTICLYLANNVVIHILSETFSMMLWTKFEELYIVKFFTNTLFGSNSTMNDRRIEHAGKSMQLLEHPHRFSQCKEKVEEKIRMLLLLSLLSYSFESLVTAILVEKNTIKMEVTLALL